jgi:hypothetical protein
VSLFGLFDIVKNAQGEPRFLGRICMTVPETARDNLGWRTYAEAMAGGEPHIILTLDTSQPVELGAFIGAFASLGNEFERYLKQTNPDLSTEGEIFVREVRSGSIVADMLPWFSLAAPLIAEMDKVLIVEQFVKLWGGRFRALLGQGTRPAPESKSELKDWSDAVRAIATDPKASAKIEAAVFEDGKRKVRAAFKFSTTQARKVLRTIERKQRQIEKKEHADHERVLLRFYPI